MNRALKRVMGGGVALALGLLPLALAEASPPMPGERVFRGHPALSDTTLGVERGAYINADQILYFGVEMVTDWHNSSNQLLGSSQLNIGIERNNGTPHVNITTNVATPDATSPSPTSTTAPSGNLNNVQGVGQLVQVTGNGNHITNNADVCVGNASQCPAIAAPTAPNNLTSIHNPTTNASAGASVTGNEASVSVSVNGQGLASQSLSSVTGLQQSSQVSGDAFQVHNQLNMVIQVQPSTTLSVPQMNDVLHTLPNM